MENLLVPFAFVGGKDGPEQQEEAMNILRGMGLADKAFVQSNQLSQVELRKMELARAMAAKPKLLISDEAMAGLSGHEVDEVLEILFDLNKLGITITSKRSGWSASIAAQMSTIMRSRLMSGYSRLPISSKTFAKRPSVNFMMLSFTTHVTRLRPCARA